MMRRIIPRLDIKGPNLVKGIQLEGLRVLGLPENFARLYYEQGADELLYMDAVASLYKRNSLLEFVEKTAREVFIPISVGGGLRTLDDIKAALRAGADKVAINTAAVTDPNFIRQASEKFGASTIVVSIDAKRRPQGFHEVFINNGREGTGLEVLEWATRAVELGAGEILLTSVDREGTTKGYDVDLVRLLAESLPVPVIASGGAGTLDHVKEVMTVGNADAVAVASILHYGLMENYDTFASPGSLSSAADAEKKRFSFGGQKVSLAELKKYLQQAGVDCREAR